MNASSRPLPTKLAAAFLTAGVISTGALVAPHTAPLPAVSVDVANASVVTDTLHRLGDVVAGAAYGYRVIQEAGASLPFDVTAALTIAAQNPTLAPSLLSWLVNRYANPSVDYQTWTYPMGLKVGGIGVVVNALSHLLGPAGADLGLITNSVNAIADAINGVLSGVLPDSTAGINATDAFWTTDVGKSIKAANLAVTAPVLAIYHTVHYLGYLPAHLEATFESALRDPSELPGLVSTLIVGLMASHGLVGHLIDTFTDPVAALPGPIGALGEAVSESLKNTIDTLLSGLPPLVLPTPFIREASEMGRVAKTTVADTTAERQVTSIPDPTVTLDNVVTLNTPEPVDNPVASSSEDSQLPNAGGTTTGLVKTNDSGPLTNVVRDSVKVKPGDTFAGAGGTVTGSDPEPGTVTTGAGTVTTGTDSAPGGTTAPSDPQQSPAGAGAGTGNSTAGGAGNTGESSESAA
ncbi:hypothetical protein ASD37_09525 [Mycobacterium sp. Root135]|uniref:hypothetical protein n=1 Tax=Mycobacterium sp. Root135 TaxID=1736457 RepID=UPI0007015CFD|nr:hypothetical protein [Mycobacterium sp. Root135]KQY08167.1 hypothetical protein ASD37_09525 [Mycobacterium sp. Root135]